MSDVIRSSYAGESLGFAGVTGDLLPLASNLDERVGADDCFSEMFTVHHRVIRVFVGCHRGVSIYANFEVKYLLTVGFVMRRVARHFQYIGFCKPYTSAIAARPIIG